MNTSSEFGSLFLPPPAHRDRPPYIPFRYTKALLKHRLRGLELKAAMEAMGYRNGNKFCRRVVQWAGLTQNRVPVAFLGLLGLTVEEVLKRVDLDRQAFDFALKAPRKPTHFLRVIMPAVHKTERLPEGITEGEAIGQIRAWAAQTGHRCILVYPELIIFHIHPNGRVRILEYRPMAEQRGDHLLFALGGWQWGFQRTPGSARF